MKKDSPPTKKTIKQSTQTMLLKLLAALFLAIGAIAGLCIAISNLHTIRMVQAQYAETLDESAKLALSGQYRIGIAGAVAMILCLILAAAIQLIAAWLIRAKLIYPLIRVREEMLSIAGGNLYSEFNEAIDDSEMGMLIDTLTQIKTGLNSYIIEISNTLLGIANGDETAYITSSYPGDFMVIQTCINEISLILTEQRHQEIISRQALEAAYEEANAANKAKSSFLSNMSHEIRTPMNAIIGMTNIALGSDDPARQRQCLHKINDASNHLLGVINDILDMSKIDANKFELAPAEFNFEEMLIRVINIINFRVDEKNQNLSLSLDSGIPETIVADSQRLAQVITNILSNAVKFTPDNGEVSMDIRLEESTGDTLKIAVAIKDSGIGISPEQQSRLFSSFTQADAGISRKFGGTGLGLVISKNIIEKMGGQIWIDSEEGKGATFSFCFYAHRGSEASGQGTRLTPFSGENLHVLVVDSDTAIHQFFNEVAKQHSFHCDLANDGQEAIERLTIAGPYHAIFIDWKSPGKTGSHELLDRLHGQGLGGSVIFMISESRWSKAAPEMGAIGIDKYIPKPLLTSVVLDKISECLDTGAANETDSNSEAMPDLSKYHLLLAEDIEINREIVIALLEPTGIQITCAENGAVCVKLFEAHPQDYDMILMDVQMPEMDGSTATQIIRALPHPNAATVPIVAMTANVFREDIEECIRIGMNDHIGKPLDFDEVIGKMKRYLVGG